MKKVLSFVLVLAMILGCTAMAFAGAETEKIAKGPFADAPTAAIATILKDMGVLFGDENGNALLDKTISRAEFCAIVLRALGLEEISKGKAKTKFADVPYDAWYSGYVATALTKKLADGKSETVFDPAGTVTADEALAFVVKGLGYDQAHLEGEWPMNYRLAAKDLGILPADYDFDDKEIKREDVFEVLYNALYKPLVEWNAKTEEWKAQGLGATTMAKRLGVATTTSYAIAPAGVVTSTIINYIKNNTGYDYSDYLGQQATFVKKGDEYIGLGKVATTTLTGTFESTTTFAAVDGTKYAVSGKLASVNVTKINGKEETSTSAAFDFFTAHAVDCDPVELEVTFKDGKIDAVYGASYWKETKVVMVSTKAAASLAEGKYTAAAVAENGFENFSTTAGLKVAGAVDDYTKIEADDIVYIYNGKNSTANAITALYVVRDVVYGSVSRYNNVTQKVTIDGTQYAYATGFFGTENEKIKASTTAAYYFFLDADEKIIAIKADLAEAAAETVYNYAFVLAVGHKDSTTSSELDGVETPKEYQIRLLPVGETESEDFVGITTTKAIASVVDEDKKWTVVAGDVVKYSLDENGEFTSLIKLGSVSDITTKHAFKANSVDGKLYASDVVIVNVISTGALSKATNYQLKTVADIKNLSFAAVVVTNAAGKVDTIIIKGEGNAAPTVTTYAAVALVGYYDAKYVDLLGAEFYEGVELNSADVVSGKAFTSIYAVTLESGKIKEFKPVEELNSNNKVRLIDKYEDGVVNSGEVSIEDATILKWNKTDNVYEESDESALVKGAKAYFVDTDKDGIYDFVAVL